jgi:AcrR family transcriptional regulator
MLLRLSERDGNVAAEVVRRPGGRSARVRAAVLSATLEELVTVGYANLSFERIARRADVHRSTLYRHWSDKHGLVTEALLARSEATVPIPDTGSLRGDLLAFGNGIVANITAPEYEAIVRAVASDTSTAQALGRPARDFWEQRLRRARVIVHRAVERGEVAEDVDPVVLLEALVGPLYLRLLITRERLNEAFVEKVVDLLAPGA